MSSTISMSCIDARTVELIKNRGPKRNGTMIDPRSGLRNLPKKVTNKEMTRWIGMVVQSRMLV